MKSLILINETVILASIKKIEPIPNFIHYKTITELTLKPNFIADPVTEDIFFKSFFSGSYGYFFYESRFNQFEYDFSIS